MFHHIYTPMFFILVKYKDTFTCLMKAIPEYECAEFEHSRNKEGEE